ncbi:glutamate--tRNA ligase [Natronospirillum operosum]|uniref:Glutamate--tRNA ligase n=1 Tax=Natronospirillum operosum TaxID=2759953 RepID=A0A4Z0WFL0_9GAMM|nr:glutamate--tRNA ligase [Natronospirillum operosum]TGG95398.1 glutamate--tRNA ligase [Natronospirillum operosum]
MARVRTRVAPSPTGDPHVGTAYIALFNRAFARSQGGDFILRIEDTDQARSTPESEQAILKALRWLGLDWDEGPDVGGDAGPYRQSERSEIYRKYADELVDKGHAFHCFCTAERLDSMRREQRLNGQPPGYDGRCKGLSQEEVQSRLAQGEKSVVRMDVPREGACEVRDMLRDPIEIEWKQVDMQVLLKSDGLPSYHLANVVDDHLMGITHVIRGEEWISSTPKHILLYQYFGWEAPVFFHMPLLRNADKSKLSKRKNPTSIDYYYRLGILPEALVNYLGMMGWTMPDGEEKFTVQEMVDNFDISRVSLGGPVFDTEKLDWLNGRYLRESLSDEEFAQRLMDWSYNRDYIMQFLPLVRERVERLSDVAPLAAFFFAGMPDIEAADFEHKKLDADTILKILQLSLWKLETQRHWDKEHIMADVKAVGEHLGLKLKDVLFPMFVSVTGSPRSVSVLEAMAILGPDMVRARLRHAIEVLGGYSKKQLKALEKEFSEIGTFLD